MNTKNEMGKDKKDSLGDRMNLPLIIYDNRQIPLR